MMFNETLKTQLVVLIVSLMLLGGLATAIASTATNFVSEAPIAIAGGGYSGGGSTNGG